MTYQKTEIVNCSEKINHELYLKKFPAFRYQFFP